MFDVEKIRYMTLLLEKIPENFDDVYLIPEMLTIDPVSLFNRLNIKIRAIMLDTVEHKDMFGIPVVKTEEASANFNERTILILLVRKSVPFIQTTFDFKVKGGRWTIPALVVTNEEITSIYDRVMFRNVLKQYKEDGILRKENQMSDLIDRFSRSLTTDLDYHTKIFKYQIWDTNNYFKPTYDFDDTAIVIQGPIIYTNNYTAETFKFYRSIYPNVPIVVSTWQGEATKSFRKECQDNSIVLLENEPPEKKMYGNINFQLKSSFAGVKYVKENFSAKFVLKTRTDQRINLFTFLIYFKNLLETFPPKDDKLQQRIIIFGSETTKNFPFNFHDFLAFGHIEDISRLYNIPYNDTNSKQGYRARHIKRVDKIGNLLFSPKCSFDYNAVTEQSHKLLKLNRAMNRIYWPESYIMRTFHEKYIAPIDTTKLFETSWKFTADYLIMVDFGTLQLDWSKYESMRYRVKFNYHGQDVFARWLDIYRNFKIDWV